MVRIFYIGLYTYADSYKLWPEVDINKLPRVLLPKLYDRFAQSVLMKRVEGAGIGEWAGARTKGRKR